MADGSVIIDTRLNNSGFRRGISSLQTDMGGLQRVVGRLGKTIFAAFSINALINFGKECVQLGSDIAEVQNVVDVAFGNTAYKIEEFAKTSIQKFGMSKLAAKETASNFMSMGKSMGLSTEAASDMAVEVAGLSGDVASFFNISQDLAKIRLRGIWTGETEALKELGVVMTETNLKEYALANGISKSYDKMSQAERVMLRYKYVTDALSLANGDFVRTQDNWANQTRILSEQWKEFMSILGDGLITILTPVLRLLNAIVAALINMANAIGAALSAVFGTPRKEIKQTAADASSVGAAIGDSTDKQKELAGATKKTAAEQKKMLANFDDLNVLTQTSSGGSGGGGSGDGAGSGGAGAGAGLRVVDAEPLGEGITKLQQFFEEAKRLAERFAEQFSKGFQMAFREPDTSALMESIRGIETSVRTLFADTDIQASAGRLFDSFARALGSFAGALASIGITIAQNIFGGINRYLSENIGYIRDRFVSVFNGLADAFDISAILFSVIADIFSVFGGDTAQKLTADIIEIFANAFLGAVDLATQFGMDLLLCITKPIVENKDKFKQAIENFLKPLETIVGTVADAVTATFEKILDTYDQYVKPAFQNLSDGWSSLTTTLLDGFNQHIAPMLSRVAQHFKEVFEDKVQPAINTVIDVFGKLILKVSEVWENYFVPFLNWVNTNIIPVFSAVFEEVANTVIDVLGGICDFITGIFTGDMEKALNGLKDVFKAPINGIISLIEKAVNWIISKINTLHWDIPDWVPGLGGKSFGFDFSQIKIPRLATGAVIPPNREFMAVLGDQKNGRNIETPEALLRQIYREESGNDAMLYTLREILDAIKAGSSIEVSGRELGRTAAREQARRNRMAGRTLQTV